MVDQRQKKLVIKLYSIMISYKRLLPLLIVAAVTVNSCKNDGCNDPLAFNYDPDGEGTETCVYEPKQISLDVQPKFGEVDLVNNEMQKMDDGRRIQISYFGAYLSNISFKEAGEEDYQRWNLNDVALIKDGQLSVDGVYLNKSSIEGFSFDIGVDTALYSDDPSDTSKVAAESPLSLQVPSMYWGWAAGYRFISIEGMVDTSAASDSSGMTPFAFHCGLPANLKSIVDDSTDISADGNSIQMNLSIDVKTLLSGIDFTTDDLIIHDGNHPVTVLIMNNALNAVRLE
ncbi:MAG TPA: hypothetical protein DCX14_06585 [Flavobacteriales bacterium]|nr:hypothetical protein [Flavobacteriales bacterium]